MGNYRTRYLAAPNASERNPSVVTAAVAAVIVVAVDIGTSGIAA